MNNIDIQNLGKSIITLDLRLDNAESSITNLQSTDTAHSRTPLAALETDSTTNKSSISSLQSKDEQFENRFFSVESETLTYLFDKEWLGRLYVTMNLEYLKISQVTIYIESKIFDLRQNHGSNFFHVSSLDLMNSRMQQRLREYLNTYYTTHRD